VIDVAIADDQALVRSGLAALLEASDDMRVVGQAANGLEAVALVARAHPHVVLMDIRMPEMDGLEATRHIAATPETAATKVIVLTTFDLDEYVYEALRGGASGFLLKDTMPDDLRAAVRVIAAGEALLAPTVTRRLIEQFAQRPALDCGAGKAVLRTVTEREHEVLVAVARGRSNTEICDELHMSLSTVKTHVSHLLMKLDARDRTQLVVIAYELGVTMPGAAL
jgi:DNA-binding NarL/FixJ family response regulator